MLLLPLCQDGIVRQMAIRCAPVALDGTPGLLRIKRKRGRWIAEIALTFCAGRKRLHQSGKVRAVRKSRGKERRWMRDVNHKLSRQIVTYAHEQGVGSIRLEKLAGIRLHISQRTARTSRGATARQAARARKNNRMKNTWSFSQLTQFITYKAERLGICVEQVDPAYTSQTCPACFAKNKADDRRGDSAGATVA